MTEMSIPDWHPAYKLNGGHGHWSTAHRAKKNDAKTAFVYAKLAGWEPVVGKATLTITLVYPAGVLPDTDNLYARAKGMVDGLKGYYFTDDNPDCLDLKVKAERGPKATRMALHATPV